MPKLSEETYNSWRLPPSNSEENKLANAERAIRNALTGNKILANMPIEVYGQGSYANDTNVRLDSDVDLNVRLTSPVFFKLPEGKTMQDFGYTPSPYTFEEYKQIIFTALGDYFGYDNVKREDKCIIIKENSYRIKADAVPTWKFNYHIDLETTIAGAKFISDAGKEILNFSLQHVQNGKLKNGRTQKRFKRVTRILKRIKNKMAAEGILVNHNITSFLIECLLYNVPDDIFNNYATWEERVRQSTLYLFNQTKSEELCKNWREVSEILLLFYQDRKWTIKDVNDFTIKLWNYLEFK
jgi:hypothetical protein